MASSMKRRWCSGFPYVLRTLGPLEHLSAAYSLHLTQHMPFHGEDST